MALQKNLVGRGPYVPPHTKTSPLFFPAKIHAAFPVDKTIQRCYNKISLPSVDKGRHGFDGQKCAHTASIPLEIRQVFHAGLSLPEHISARQNCFAPASDGFPSDFWLLSRRRAGARQGEKGKKRRKGALAGVFALVNRWYYYGRIPCQNSKSYLNIPPPATSLRP